MEQILYSNSPEETAEIGKRIAKKIKKGLIFAFFGNLGSGKTTFIQGLAKGLGIKKRIISPTFILIRKYPFGKKTFYHMDFYRINKDQNEFIEVKELLEDPNNIIAIEWPEKVRNFLPKKRVEILMDYVSENKRKITIKTYE